ncbi:hypothetical protein VPH35_007933 [Triticum aestivum]
MPCLCTLLHCTARCFLPADARCCSLCAGPARCSSSAAPDCCFSRPCTARPWSSPTAASPGAPLPVTTAPTAPRLASPAAGSPRLALSDSAPRSTTNSVASSARRLDSDQLLRPRLQPGPPPPLPRRVPAAGCCRDPASYAGWLCPATRPAGSPATWTASFAARRLRRDPDGRLCRPLSPSLPRPAPAEPPLQPRPPAPALLRPRAALVCPACGRPLSASRAPTPPPSPSTYFSCPPAGLRSRRYRHLRARPLRPCVLLCL